MKHQHVMPFGTQVLDDGRVRFRLWAPASEKVSLCIEQGTDELSLPMEAQPQGWFECITDRAGAGTRYRYRISDEMRVPDPASRYNPDDVHQPSEVIAPQSFTWTDTHWRGRPWEEVVLYELHVGTFSPEGTFKGVQDRLDYLVDLGVTAIELMPVADFPGKRDWGYDGVLLFAPDHTYGRPEDLKNLIQAAHEKGLMVFLDVVYNHFGPEGNYLHLYAPPFFKDEHTPWGVAINYDAAQSRTVRDFYIHNVLYWLDEYRFDGLRLDAVHSILDDSSPDILDEIAEAVRNGPGRERHIHLVLENDNNETCYLERPGRFDAQWNDDIHHALHVLLTGESGGYYRDYADHPMRHLLRCLTQGFAYQGEPSLHRGGARRGTPSAQLPATAFVSLLQNHDQVGNRAFGERLSMLADPRPLRAATAVLLLTPEIPLLFMGEEYGARTPFLFFCDFGRELAQAVTDGRRKEFAKFPAFTDPAARNRIPDPSHPDTFQHSKLDWDSCEETEHQSWLALYKTLLRIRREHLVSRLQGLAGGNSTVRLLGERSTAIEWRLGDGSRLTLLANLGKSAVLDVAVPDAPLLFASEDDIAASLTAGTLPPWSVAWILENTKNE
ncbi:MAG TPA: malto-oligosyltrehalose trehalohydrolase [Methylophilaceae bacterium]|nr:malto-oligosyltrehalose trehalohydrolase [Methylophilaceae bacterium]